jgi:hypothetical protein
VTEELEVLAIVTKRLDSRGIPYMLTGSFAGNYYAVPRMARDIDIVIEVSEADADHLYDLFEDDFYIDSHAVRTALARRTSFNVIHTALVVKVDFLVRKDSDYRHQEFQRRRRVTIDDITVFIVAPEDLIISKLDWSIDSCSDVQLADALDDEVLRVTDTSPAVEAKYRAMLLERSGEERLKMADSMYATARALVVASILEVHPTATLAELRCAVFLRFYGCEFDPETRKRVLARLAADAVIEHGPART